MIRFTLVALFTVIVTLPVHGTPCISGPPNLVSNCGFETGDFTNWTLSGHDSASGYNGIDYGVDSADSRSGVYGIYVAGFGGVLDLSQILPTTAGTSYVISFCLAQSLAPIAPYENSFSANFGSDNLVSLMQVPAIEFTEYQFSASALSTQTALVFGARDDNGFFSIDDVSVTAVATPEPRAGCLALSGVGLGICLLRRRTL